MDLNPDSDTNGRTRPFQLTLLLTSIFGTCSAFAPSFSMLCFSLFGLGVGVGGSMPTDGTLFLENIPRTHHYLLTALSTFFSFGAVLTSTLSLLIIPRYSCSESAVGAGICDVEVSNTGWRYLLAVLGLIVCLVHSFATNSIMTDCRIASSELFNVRLPHIPLPTARISSISDDGRRYERSNHLPSAHLQGQWPLSHMDGRGCYRLVYH